MIKRAKTIQIFLPDGDPKGIKVACITSRIVEMTYIPRARLGDATKRECLSGVGIYFLVGGEDQIKSEVYIGEAENCLNRLSQHNKQKDFWNYALVITSRTGDFTKTHAKYLEWLCHDKALAAKRCSIHNSTIPTKSYVDEQMKAFILDVFDTVEVLTPTLGLNMFQQPSLQALIKEAVLQDFTFTEDYTFSSPSTAAEVVLGRASNGWTSWINENDQTLDEVYRQ
jgi:hypothetical protein